MKEKERIKMLEFLVKRREVSLSDIKEISKMLNFSETDVLIMYRSLRNLEKAIELAILLSPNKEISCFLARNAISKGFLWGAKKLIESGILTIEEFEEETQEEFINAVQNEKIEAEKALDFIEKYKIYTNSICEVCGKIIQLCLKNSKKDLEDAFRAAKIISKIGDGDPKGMMKYINILLKTITEKGLINEIKEIEELEKISGKNFTAEIEAVVKNAIIKIITETTWESWQDIKYGINLLTNRGKKFSLASKKIDQIVMSYSKIGSHFPDAVSVVQDLGASRKAIDFLIKKSIESENFKIAIEAGKKFGIKQLSFELVESILSKPHKHLRWLSRAIELRRKPLTYEEVDRLVRKILSRCYPSISGVIESSINITRKFGASKNTISFLVKFCLENDFVLTAGEIVAQFETDEELRRVVIEKCLKQGGIEGVKQALEIVRKKENREFSQKEIEILLKSFV